MLCASLYVHICVCECCVRPALSCPLLCCPRAGPSKTCLSCSLSWTRSWCLVCSHRKRLLPPQPAPEKDSEWEGSENCEHFLLLTVLLYTCSHLFSASREAPKLSAERRGKEAPPPRDPLRVGPPRGARGRVPLYGR